MLNDSLGNLTLNEKWSEREDNSMFISGEVYIEGWGEVRDVSKGVSIT